MLFINKRNKANRKNGHHIINMFIKGCWQEDSNMYINCDYNTFKRNLQLKQLLLHEQHGLCCYCMREINSDNMTIEHVAPQACSINDFNIYYTRFGAIKCKRAFWADNKGLVMRIIINKKTKNLHSKRSRPHFMAYENLVASCNGKLPKDRNDKDTSDSKDTSDEYGKFCCNNKRGMQRIVPIFFLNNASKIIRYAKDGKLIYDEIKYKKDFVDIVNLDYFVLVRMRKAWFQVCNEFELKKIIEAKGEQIKDVSSVISSDIKIFIESYWDLFLQYKWFYSYYKHKMVI